MILFWSAIIILTIIALAFLIIPLLSYKKVSPRFASENLTVKSLCLSIVFIIVLFPLFSLLMYSYWGKSELVAQELTLKNRNDNVRQEIAKYGSRHKIILALRHKLDQLPKDENSAKGWYLLGKLYFNEKNYVSALQSFKQAVLLKPDEPDYVLQFVSANFYINHKLTAEDATLLEKLLKRDPNNINAMNLLALDAFQQKQFDKAIRYWESLLKYFPIDSDDSKSLIAMISQAQNQLPVINNAFAKIKVTINLSATFKNNLSQSNILFVYALDAGGSKIPLAALRLDIKQFPVHLALGDLQSMLPGKSLANANKFYVEARVSKSGNALPAKGDLVGKSEVISKDSRRPLQINIATVVN
ncbi:MAG: tetratricopeptide repeat protein [Gammaproteobacteria bacterium]|nr:tetratricopeptide repeat protein [Gammaproteobacteria bacterium]